MISKKTILGIAIAIPLIALAREVSHDANGSPFMADTTMGANMIIRSSVNLNSIIWRDGDRVKLTQGNLENTYVYRTGSHWISGGASRLLPKRRHKKLN
jgi:hypothetical protein